MKFPYIQFQKKFSPIVPIRLRHRNKEWTEHALILRLRCMQYIEELVKVKE